jgi:hypothetical protein
MVVVGGVFVGCVCFCLGFVCVVVSASPCSVPLLLLLIRHNSAPAFIFFLKKGHFRVVFTVHHGGKGAAKSLLFVFPRFAVRCRLTTNVRFPVVYVLCVIRCCKVWTTVSEQVISTLN